MARGGARPGAGRKKGQYPIRTREPAVRAIQRAAATGEMLPLDVHLANMRHYYHLAVESERILQETAAQAVEGMEPKQQFEYLMAEVKKAAGFREMADVSAMRAAPFIHARLAAVQIQAPQPEQQQPGDDAKVINGNGAIHEDDPLVTQLRAWGHNSKATN